MNKPDGFFSTKEIYDDKSGKIEHFSIGWKKNYFCDNCKKSGDCIIFQYQEVSSIPLNLCKICLMEMLKKFDVLKQNREINFPILL